MERIWTKVDTKDTWKGKTAFVVGGGPSLKPYISQLRNLSEAGDAVSKFRFVGANDSYKHCKCDATISCDFNWLTRRAPEFPSAPCPVFGVIPEDSDYNFKFENIPNLGYLKSKDRGKVARLSDDPAYISNGLNSGFSALNYAYLKRPAKIFLLGLDFSMGVDGATHFHEGYSWHSEYNTIRLYKSWAAIIDSVAKQLADADIEVYNCSPTKSLKAYKYVPYQEALK